MANGRHEQEQKERRREGEKERRREGEWSGHL
jgi:hypothetical protein